MYSFFVSHYVYCDFDLQPLSITSDLSGSLSLASVSSVSATAANSNKLKDVKEVKDPRDLSKAKRDKPKEGKDPKEAKEAKEASDRELLALGPFQLTPARGSIAPGTSVFVDVTLNATTVGVFLQQVQPMGSCCQIELADVFAARLKFIFRIEIQKLFLVCSTNFQVQYTDKLELYDFVPPGECISPGIEVTDFESIFEEVPIVSCVFFSPVFSRFCFSYFIFFFGSVGWKAVAMEAVWPCFASRIGS